MCYPQGVQPLDGLAKVAQKFSTGPDTVSGPVWGFLNMDTAPNEACIYQGHFCKNRPIGRK